MARVPTESRFILFYVSFLRLGDMGEYRVKWDVPKALGMNLFILKSTALQIKTENLYLLTRRQLQKLQLTLG